MRNATDNNAANIEFIEALQPQGVMEAPELEEAGLRVEMDAAKGKFRFVQKSP